MDFTASPRAREIAAALRRFLDRAVIPLEGPFLESGFGAVAQPLAAVREEARLLEFAQAGEVLGRSPLGHYACHCQAPDAGNLELLLHHGSPEQKERWLRPLARGEVRSCFAMTEPDYPGSNPVWMGTVARREGDEYVLDGNKWFTSSADGAAFAVVMALTDPEAADRYARASLFLVPTDAPGFTLRENLPVMGERGEGWASHGAVDLAGVRVPAADRLGAEGAGFALAQERLGPGRIHHCMRWIGICERAFDLLCDRAASRELSPGIPLGSKAFVQAWIAESRAEIDAARLLVLRTAWRIDREGAKAVRNDVSLLKFHVAAVLQRVLDRSIQAHGAYGLLDRTPLAYWWRHERAARIYDGPDEVHLIAAGKRILAARGIGA
jgi:acyl-CoA dehydrogenase